MPITCGILVCRPFLPMLLRKYPQDAAEIAIPSPWSAQLTTRVTRSVWRNSSQGICWQKRVSQFSSAHFHEFINRMAYSPLGERHWIVQRAGHRDGRRTRLVQLGVRCSCKVPFSYYERPVRAKKGDCWHVGKIWTCPPCVMKHSVRLLPLPVVSLMHLFSGSLGYLSCILWTTILWRLAFCLSTTGFPSLTENEHYLPAKRLCEKCSRQMDLDISQALRQISEELAISVSPEVLEDSARTPLLQSCVKEASTLFQAYRAWGIQIGSCGLGVRTNWACLSEYFKSVLDARKIPGTQY